MSVGKFDVDDVGSWFLRAVSDTADAVLEIFKVDVDSRWARKGGADRAKAQHAE